MLETCVALTVLGLALAPGASRTVLSLPPLVYLGRRSYAIYLFHLFIYQQLRTERTHLGSTAQFWLLMAVTLLVAEFSWRYIESPFIADAAATSASRSQPGSVNHGAAQPAPPPLPPPPPPPPPESIEAAYPRRVSLGRAWRGSVGPRMARTLDSAAAATSAAAAGGVLGTLAAAQS